MEEVDNNADKKGDESCGDPSKSNNDEFRFVAPQSADWWADEVDDQEVEANGRTREEWGKIATDQQSPSSSAISNGNAEKMQEIKTASGERATNPH